MYLRMAESCREAEVDDIAGTAQDGAFGLVDGGPSGGDERTFAVDGEQPSASETITTARRCSIAVAEAVAVGAEPVTILFLAIVTTVHGQRVFASGLFELNSSPHGLTGHVDRFVEGGGDPFTGNGRVNGLLGEKFTGLIVETLTVDTEGVVVVGSLIVGANEILGRDNLHTHGSASVGSGGQTDTP